MKNYSKYIGRFAPSPTGELHIGSLITALASYLRARSQNGKWLLRIEDVDKTRIQKGAIISILKTIESHGMYWDENVIYQSQRNNIYSTYLKKLKEKNLVYNCFCSRKKISQFPKNKNTLESIYSGFCRNTNNQYNLKYSVRLNCEESSIVSFVDKIQGEIKQNIEIDVGDFILWRNENFASYHFAAIVDDELQGVTEVVRGSDLLFQTPRQIFLQKCLNFQTPEYFHVPIAVNEWNQKLSKQTKAQPLKRENAIENIIQSLNFLGFNKYFLNELKNKQLDPEKFIDFTITHFNEQIIPKKIEIKI